MKSEKITLSHESAPNRWYQDACGAALALEFVGERWALLVIRELMLGPRRFSELRADLPGLSANVLTQRLDGLERSGVVQRRRLPPPAAVQVYELTDWGREAEPIFHALGRWALRRAQAPEPAQPHYRMVLGVFAGVVALLVVAVVLVAMQERPGTQTALTDGRVESYKTTVNNLLN